jgi:PLD-like domain
VNATIGSSLSQSLVAELGDDCAAAAQLAAAIADRPAGAIDGASLPSMPRATLARVAADFVRRGWLLPIASGWKTGPTSLPRAVIPFLDGAAAMRSHDASRETATAIVTMPPPPSAIAVALSQTGLAYSSLVSTNDALRTVADKAIDTFTIMTPFLNPEGLQFVQTLFARTRASNKRLVVRRAGDATRIVMEDTARLTALGVEAFDYTIEAGDGFETFHAKVALADNELAYVGSANMTVFARHSMDLGFLVEGRSARVVANVVRAVTKIARPIILLGTR